MASIVSNLIEYAGLVDCLPDLPEVAAFKQFSVMETVCLPHAKPDIEQIVKVMAEVVITNTHVIRTPVATSEEGQILTGRKLIVEGIVRQKVEYVADCPEQAVHAAHFDVPFSTFIVLPPLDDENGMCTHNHFTVTPYIEDIFAQQVSKRCIFKNITILLVAE